MNNSSNSQLPTLKENGEIFSFETMKGEFISIIDGLLKAYETSLHSDGITETEKNDKYFTKINTIFLTKISTLTNGFISEYQEYFNIFLFEVIFGPHFLSDENPNITKKIRNYISHKIARQKDDNRTKYMHDTISSYNIQNESAKCKGEIDKLLSYDENLLGYVIFKIFGQKIGDIENLNSLLSWVEILQKTGVFTDTITKVEIDNFLFKYREQLNTNMFLGLISSGRGEEVVQEIIATPENSKRKMDAIIFVMEFYEERYKSYIPKLFEVYISGMKDKIKTSNLFRGTNNLRKIYKYYKENKTEINPELDVEGAFEIYSELFKTEDLKGDLSSLYCGDLPMSYIKIAFSGFVKKILNIRNRDYVRIGLRNSGAINVLLSNIDHGSHGLPGFSEKIELSNNEIYELQKLGYDSQDGLKMPDYIKTYTFMIRKILYSELNLRIYGDNEKISKGLTKNYITAKKELDSMMSKILFLPEEKEFNFNI